MALTEVYPREIIIDIGAVLAYEQIKKFHTYAPVAQLDRVPDYESVGRKFESCRAHQ